MQFAKEVEFLRLVVSEAGIKTDPRKTVYILSDPTSLIFMEDDDNVSSQRASWPSGSLKFANQQSDPGTVLAVNSCPYR